MALNVNVSTGQCKVCLSIGDWCQGWVLQLRSHIKGQQGREVITSQEVRAYYYNHFISSVVTANNDPLVVLSKTNNPAKHG